VLANRRRAVALTRLRDAATDGAFDLTLLHHDRDFAAIAGVTGQAPRWYGPD
jgi:hypothetical protein